MILRSICLATNQSHALSLALSEKHLDTKQISHIEAR